TDGDTIGNDRVIVRLEGKQLTRRELDVTPETASHEATGRTLVGDTRIEAEPGDVEEQATVDLAAIDRALHAIERDGEGRFGPYRDPELARESVSGSNRNDSEHTIAKRDNRGNVVDRTVAAPRNQGLHASRNGSRSELAGVTGTLGQVHLRRDAARVHQLAGELRSTPRHLEASSRAGDRIDDDRDAQSPSFRSTR